MTTFRNREEAALLLAIRLGRYRGRNPLVLGIPRGAMPMAEIIADELGGELGAVLVHKIPAPDNEEFAIGSIGLSGAVHRNIDPGEYGISEEYLAAAGERELGKLRRKQSRFGLTSPVAAGRTVIVVDDGIATGSTAMAAVHEVRALGAASVVLAAAVVAKDTGARLRRMVDELVVLDEPELFFAVGQFFTDFSEVSDDEVERILARHRRSGQARAAGFS